MPERSCFNRAIVSGRKPRMLSAGMSDTAPTWKDPVPVAGDLDASVVGIASGSELQGELGVGRLAEPVMGMVCRSLGPDPQTRLTATAAPGSPASTTRPE